MYTQRLEIWLVGLAVAFVFLKVNSFLEAREENDS